MSDPFKDSDDRNLVENEEAIEKALNYLKYHDPANANRDYAIGLLKRMQSAASSIADKTSLDFEKFAQDSEDIPPR